MAFRSEEMYLLQLFFQTESAHHCINQLGLLGLVHFTDLNPDTTDFQRRFVKEVKKCEEMERILRFLEAEMLRCNIPMAAAVPTEATPCPRDVLQLEAKIKKLEEELKEINSNHETLKRNCTELLEISSLLRLTRDVLEETDSQLSCSELPSEDSVSVTITSSVGRRRGSSISASGPPKLGFIAGVIKHERFPTFEKLLWRLFHENFLLRHAEIERRSEDVRKDAFLIFVQGDQVQRKIRKVCDGFHVHLYPCPNTVKARDLMNINVRTRIEELQTVVRRTEEFRAAVLHKAAVSVQDWFRRVRKMKAIYHTLNLCNIDITHQLIVAEVWCPVSDLSSVQRALYRASEQSGCSVSPVINRIQTQQTPPTFNRTNSFTRGFQAIVDAYGVSSYGELNPAPYSLVTFPFLFAVMFGDCGHGLVMTLAAVWMMVQEEKLRRWSNELLDVLLDGRYIVLMMGVFSIYTGLIYNDCFSKSLNVLGSSWSVRPMFQPHGPWSNQTLHNSGHLQLDPGVSGVYSGHPYMLGIDPIWNMAANKLSFLNSYKMKMSVILGICHMVFGVTLSLVNYMHFGDVESVLLRFVPELLFMASLFGYLTFLILYKWCVSLRPDSAPSILLTFINMMLFSSESQHSFLYRGQMSVQVFLVLQALLMVPMMLLVKPLLVYRRRLAAQHKARKKVALQSSSGGNDGAALPSQKVKDEQVCVGDVFVYEAIHTIEHCLGCVSNTASYLRLWSLSLAHAELSEVLWRLVLRVGLSGSSLLLSLLFGCFVVLTVCVLILMEGLSAFLHAVRLHWVEFQNKFYQGAGYRFTPLSFTKL